MRRMDQMMNSMMQPFGSMFPSMPGFPALTNNSNSLSVSPYTGFGDSLFPSVNHMFSNIQNMANDPNCHSYSSSSVMTYTMDGNGRPKVYQATSSTRSAPGGVKEIRNTMRNSETGQQQMSIGHHIEDKAHIVEKSRNVVTGQNDETEEFINIEEDQADEFNREWVSKTQYSRPRITAVENTTDDDDEKEVEIIEVSPSSPLAITAGPSQSSSHHAQRQPHPAHHHSRKRERHELAADSHKASSHRNKKLGHKRSSKHSHLPRYESHM
ncbi:Myeloid leukemia factor 2 [Nymphon striatum]|nr:Myeloid leukemia factor 2 [Nymphon striatum]